MKGVRVQRWVANLFLPLTYIAVACWMRFGRRYRIRDRDLIRRRFKEIVGRDPRPLLICANHLTLVDSMLIIWALGGVSTFLLFPQLFPWNLPERRNFAHRLSLRVLCYLGKCVHVVRGGGSEEARRSLDQVKSLLEAGESVMIFPEGGRTRIGRVDTDNFSYAAGRILHESPNARVLYVYLRGKRQEGYSDFPERGEEFDLDIAAGEPSSSETGLRASRDLSRQIIEQLARMEQAYFSAQSAHR